MKLLIVIPALNEESSIENILQRSLDARRYIIGNSPVTQVEISVVSDGSTDRTVELASRYVDSLRLIVFKHNRGYGAAIKEAWKDTDAELLGFLDADGTCDPRFFATLCAALVKEDADMVLGCRLHNQTQMPVIRQIGNLIFASLLTVVSHTRIRDTASGMRVLRRDAYRRLLPLPNGLHFTPAMTARTVLGAGGKMKLLEIDMPYSERKGESKLKVVRDGFRFLRIILEAVFLYHPARPFAVTGLVCLAIAIMLMAAPVVHYWKTRTVEEWMLYRFILGHLAASSALLMFSVALLSRRVVQITVGAKAGLRASSGWLYKAFLSPFYWLAPGLLIGCGIALVVPNILARVLSGAAFEHWSRFIAMSFFWLVAVILISARVVAYCLDLIAEQLAYLQSEPKIEKAGRGKGAYASS
jgi:glycosyltransferase involved in cell wall biosynthesis